MYSARRLDIYVKSSDGMAGPGSGDEFGAGCGRGGGGDGGWGGQAGGGRSNLVGFFPSDYQLQRGHRVDQARGRAGVESDPVLAGGLHRLLQVVVGEQQRGWVGGWGRDGRARGAGGGHDVGGSAAAAGRTSMTLTIPLPLLCNPVWMLNLRVRGSGTGGRAACETQQSAPLKETPSMPLHALPLPFPPLDPPTCRRRSSCCCPWSRRVRRTRAPPRSPPCR